MKLDQLRAIAIDKSNFRNLADFRSFTLNFLEFAEKGFQAAIVSQNENYYRFWQFRKDGNFNVSRPINSNLIYSFSQITKIEKEFLRILKSLRDLKKSSETERDILRRTIYTIPQTLGVTLDSLPAGQSNTARKINGDLFELFIRLLIKEAGIECDPRTVQIPIKYGKEILFYMSYQHDLILKKDGKEKVLGSVKTSSKDRLDKIFLDKFLFSKLTETALPYIAIFLNDVQRKNTRKEREYGINATFLPGHFKGYTIKLNALDGVYYCDIRPNMLSDEFLRKYIKTIDHFFFEDMWKLTGIRK